MKGSSLGLYFDPRGAGSTPARDKAFFFHIPLSRLFLFSSFVLPLLNYLLNIEFARYKISTNWDHKADWANGKGGVSRSAIDYRQTFPELQPSLSIQDTNYYLYHNHWHMRYAGVRSRSRWRFSFLFYF